ncbi:MAG: hypothetical protein M5U35_02495 [Roseovarius sp.]|nr:hypothetical protein [Roseovarius sp.]
MTQDMLTSFFGWMAVLNLAFLILGGLMVMAMRDWAVKLHSRLFGLEAAVVRQAIYVWLGNYKIATFVFSVVPYLALRLV